MLRISGADIGFLQFLEHRALFARVGRPDVSQPAIETLGLGAQEPQIMDMTRIRAAREKYAVVELFGRLMQEKCRSFVATLSDQVVRAFFEIGGSRKVE